MHLDTTEYSSTARGVYKRCNNQYRTEWSTQNNDEKNSYNKIDPI